MVWRVGCGVEGSITANVFVQQGPLVVKGGIDCNIFTCI